MTLTIILKASMRTWDRNKNWVDTRENCLDASSKELELKISAELKSWENFLQDILQKVTVPTFIWFPPGPLEAGEAADWNWEDISELKNYSQKEPEESVIFNRFLHLEQQMNYLPCLEGKRQV